MKRRNIFPYEILGTNLFLYFRYLVNFGNRFERHFTYPAIFHQGIMPITAIQKMHSGIFILRYKRSFMDFASANCHTEILK